MKENSAHGFTEGSEVPKEQDASHSFEKIPWGKQEDIDALNAELTRLRSELQQERERVERAFLAGRSKTSWEQFQEDEKTKL